MDARIYQLDTIRSARNTPIFMDELSPMQLALDGSALLLSAMSFWVECAVALASFHHSTLLACFSPNSKTAKIVAFR